jgi:hypothetical protein
MASMREGVAVIVPVSIIFKNRYKSISYDCQLIFFFRAFCMNSHRASCILRGHRRFDGTISHADALDFQRCGRGLSSQIQNISKTACTAQEPLTYFRVQTTPPDNKKIEREQS